MPKHVRNNFYFFMKEMQEEYKQQNLNYNMRQMSDIAGPLWKVLSPEERAKYDGMASAFKRNTSGIENKLASDGTSIEQNYRDLEAVEQNERYLQLAIRQYVGSVNTDARTFYNLAPQQSHFVMVFNILCATEDFFIPLEVGISKYSLQDGVQETYHKFIDPGRMPTGLHGEAKMHSEDSHQLLFADVPKSDNYKEIFRDISIFLGVSVGEEMPPIFTVSEGVPQTAGCLSWLSHKAGKGRLADEFKVWDLAYLMYEMRAGVEESLTSLQMAADLLKQSSFDYTIGINCNFHEEADSRHCALGIAQRQCYLLSDTVCPTFDIEMTNKHIPNRAEEVKPYQVYCPPAQRRTETTVPRTVRIGDNADHRSEPSYETLDDFTNVMPMGFGRGVRAVTERLGQVKINFDPSKGVGRGRPVLK